ncbi:MAG: NAD(P)/FAD-dependent oxidoreductase [Faecalibacterium sp.]|jgi:glycerol-3-phosphate dehydrogenase|nr:NAD(P)/FAD-dependent oxidoreductase [Faecalibacterium sp.]
MYDIAVVGCGVIGAATAYALSRYDCRVVVLEAQNDVADGTTKANSAILHAGYDPEPGTRMARLNVTGVAMAKEICAKLDVPYRPCGSLVLALSQEDLPHIRHLYENGVANGVPGIRLLSAAETLAMEPGAAPTVAGALYAPSAAIVSPWEYALAMIEVAVRNGVELRRSCSVSAITRTEAGFSLAVPGGTVEAKYIVNAAGIFAEAVHAMVAPPQFHIQPTRGEYYLLDKSEGARVNHVIFQCPNAQGKGVLVSPTVHGNLIVGPNAERVEGENTACTAAGLAYVSATALRSIPGIRFGESIRNFAGVRANVDVDDFVIGEAPDAPGLIDLAGMKSPGLSSAPAVAEEAVQLLAAKNALGAKKAAYRDGRKHVRFKALSPAEKEALIRKNPAYGRVICRCETITEGEILDAIHSEVPATTIDGVKRRCNAGMGRCQGGFCGPRVLELLSRELHISPLEVLQDKAGTNVLVSETKLGGKHA